jgi:hypothetical protein
LKKLKTMLKKISVLTLVCIVSLTALQGLSVKCSSDLHVSIASGFIQSALPIERSKYNVTIYQGEVLNNYAVACLLQSEQSVLNVNCYIQNNILRGCNLYIKNGSIIYDKSYTDPADLAIGFLEQYQTYIGRASTELINTLRNVDAAKNLTEVSGNIKLTVLYKDSGGSAFSNKANGTTYTSFSWAWTIEGVDYPLMSVSFQNGDFYGFTDCRGIYTIGDTSVNTTKGQAINAAMEYLKTYSYEATKDSFVSGFVVNENRTVAKLSCATKNSSELYPIWNVIVFLEHVYPGAVKAFSINIWAKSGEVFHIGIHQEPRAPVEYYSVPEVNSEVSSLGLEYIDVPSGADAKNSDLINNLAIAIVAFSIPAVVLAVFVRRRHK